MNPITQSQAYLSPVYRSIAITHPTATLAAAPVSAPKAAISPPTSTASPASSLLAKLDKLKVTYTYNNSTSLLCRYQAEDGPERCEFTVSNFQSSPHLERTEGCCFLFRRISSELAPAAPTATAEPKRMFRCLALPKEMAEEEPAVSVKQELQRMDKLAGKSCEQKEQFCAMVSSMLMRGEHVAECREILQNKPTQMLNQCVVKRMTTASAGEQCC